VKRYLNRQEKDYAKVMGAFAYYFSDLVKIFEELKRTKNLIRNTKMARTYADKALEELLKDLDPLEIVRVAAENQKMKVSVQYKVDALKEFEAIKKADDVTPILTDDFLDLVDHALVVCRSCPYTGDQVEGCRLRKVMLKHDIEPFNLEAPVGVCCYKQVSE
jgi:hypothetical protein